MRAGPGTRRVFEGFYKVRFQLGERGGRSVMHVGNGKMLGGNSAFAHIGTYAKTGAGVDVAIRTVRHNPDPNYRAMAGTDDATLLARGWADGDLYRFSGELKELPGVPFQSVMTPITEAAAPVGVGGGGIVDGLYSVHLRMLDGVDGGLTGVMLLNRGRILGGDASFYYLGSYTAAAVAGRARSSTRSTPRPRTIRSSAATRSASASPAAMTRSGRCSRDHRCKTPSACSRRSA
jgi:hypothetical protein